MQFRIAALSLVSIIVAASFVYSDEIAQGVEIQGILCKKGQVFYYPSGKLEYATLAKTQQIQGIDCLGNEPVRLYESGRISSSVLSHAQVIRGIPCAGNCSVWMHESGPLAFAVLSKDCEIFANKFVRGTQIHFDESGKILTVQGKAQVINGIKFDRSAQVYINESGRIERVFLHRSQTIKGKRYPAYAYLFFDKAGNVEKSHKSQKQEIGIPDNRPF
jgi:hypothetical protein